MTGAWIVYSLLVSACAACVALAADAMMRAARRPTRWVWAATFVAGTIIPALVAVRPRVVSSVAPIGSVSSFELTGTSVAQAATMSIDAWLSLAWVAATLGVVFVLLVGLVQLSRARRRADRGMLAGREIALTADLGPGALPFGNPKILVPRWASSLPADAARLLVIHEEEHVKAGDARLLMGAAIVLAAMPWNVVLWWSLRRLRTAIELDCDARVLRSEPSIAPYAELLLQVAGRGRAAPALLALTDSTAQLKTRIDAMTTFRHMSRSRRVALGAFAVAALVVGCETRRPAPVAPVSDFVVANGRASATVTSQAQAESVKVRVEGEIARVASRIAGDSALPLLVVKDASGQTLHVARLSRSGGTVGGPASEDASELAGLPPDDIATVDITKRGDLLPGEARSGLITVVLKPGATWRPPARTDSNLPYKSEAGALRRREVPERPAPAAAIAGRDAPERTAEVPAGVPPVERLTLESAQGEVPPLHILDASGTLLYEGLFTRGADGTLAGYRLDPNAISRVEVQKGARGKLITIVLKPGAALKR